MISLMGNIQNRQVQRQSTLGEQVEVTADRPSSALPPVPPGDREALQAAMGQHHPAGLAPSRGPCNEQRPGRAAAGSVPSLHTETTQHGRGRALLGRREAAILKDLGAGRGLSMSRGSISGSPKFATAPCTQPSGAGH